MSLTRKAGWPSVVTLLAGLTTAPKPWVNTRWRFTQPEPGRLASSNSREASITWVIWLSSG